MGDQPAGFDATGFMMQSSIINETKRQVSTGIWWVDMVIGVGMMGFLGALFKELPRFIAWLQERIEHYLHCFRNAYFPQTELVLECVAWHNDYGDVYYGDTTRTFHMVRALEHWLCEQGYAKERKLVIRNNGRGRNDYQKMKTHSIQMKSLDPSLLIEDDIAVIRSVQKHDPDQRGVSKRITKYRLRTKRSTDELQDFLRKVYDDYVERDFGHLMRDDTRRFYTLDVAQEMAKSGSGDQPSQKHLSSWRRYDMVSDRQFETIFFDQKQQVVELLQHFENRSGIFARENIPYKLSFLLHGPPGTGKTSFIRALATRLNRHIINPELPLIKTNAQLRDVFFNESITYYDNYGKTIETVPLDQRIYILEDIDALSDIVKNRETKKPKDDESSSKELGLFSDYNSTVSSKLYSRYSIEKDALNLSGLLNVLDGVLQLHGAVIVMTTNHPEKLDPALIRPGRITMELEMGYMSPRSMDSMLSYYFPDAKPLEAYPTTMTPAKLESLCYLHYSSFDEVMDAISLQE